MPSIMDLVREYSELEIRRSQRGGMLEPQAEIRYQALKFFLEFDLFPFPVQKPAEIQKSHDRKKVVSSSEILKPSEEKPLVSSNIHEVKEEIIPTIKPEVAATDLVSVISETSLPVNDAMETNLTITEPVEEIIEAEIPVSSVESHDINTDEKLQREEALDIVDAVDEAVENVILPDTSLKAASAAEEKPVIPEEGVSKSQENLAIDGIDKTDLSSHIDNAFDSVIQLEEVNNEQEGVIQNTLPDIPAVVQETTNINVISEATPAADIKNNEVLPETPSVIETAPVDIVQDVIPVQEEVVAPPIISVEDLLAPPTTLSPDMSVEAQVPVINIEEIVNNVSSDTTSQQTQETYTAPQIDFLSGLGIPSEKQSPSVKTEQELKEPEAISIEEIIPADFTDAKINAGASNKGVVFIDIPSKAAVHMIDGDARRGIIKELTDTLSEIELFDDESLQNSSKIPVSDIKAIFIMKHASDKNVVISGQRINVRFKDDRSISGISPDYSDDKQIFTLFPAEGGQSVRMIVVYRGFVDQVEML